MGPDAPLVAALSVLFLLASIVGLLRARRRYLYAKAPKMTVEFDYSGGGLVELVTKNPESVRNLRIDGQPAEPIAIPGSSFAGILMPDDSPHHVSFDVLT